jgi:hypothetical protein
MSTTSLRLLGFLTCSALGSCQAMYFSTMASFGVEKREILVERVEEAHDALKVAKVRFDNSLATFRDVVRGEQSTLQTNYERFADAYDRTESAAEDLHDTVESFHEVAVLMFEEWKRDSGEILDNELRRSSLENHSKAMARYERTLRAFRRVEAKMDPMLTRFRDHVLFLKLNLHPQALGTLRESEESILEAMNDLGRAMDNALTDGAAFIETMSF